MRVEVAIRLLEKALQRLAWSADQQIAHIARHGVGPDELALEFDDIYRVVSGMAAEQLIPENLMEPLEVIDGLFQEMTREPKGKWTENAVSSSKEWAELRTAASNVLTPLAEFEPISDE
ncbi:hypothetical protein [Streptomyces sp. NPDC058755]|uniref:hypothetical protein n=1 Tax=Streptomyces sp. NPDC058755 TaxID=3346624 RepID=UPI0036C6C17C